MCQESIDNTNNTDDTKDPIKQVGHEESAASELFEYARRETMDVLNKSDLEVHTNVSDSSTIIYDLSESILTDFSDDDDEDDDDDDDDNDDDDAVSFPHLEDFRKEYPKNFIFAHLNINFFHTKFHEVHEILSKNHVDFYAISETKLNPTIKSEQFKFFLKDYSFYRQDRPHAVRGGGLVCYVRSCLPHTPRKDLAYNQDGMESMVFEVIMKKQKWFFIILYRPPDVSIIYLRSAIDYICIRCQVESQTMFLIGDINVDFSKENNPLKCVLDDYGLQNVIKGPTCFKNHERPTLIDVILTNCPRRLTATLNANIGVSDYHNQIQAATKMYAPKSEKRVISYRTYKNFKEEDYLNELQNTPFHVSNIFDDPDDQFWFYNKLLENVMDSHAPRKMRTIPPIQLPYMNGQLRKAINIKGMLKRKYDTFKTQNIKRTYRKHCNLVTKLKRQSMGWYLKKNCKKNNSGDNKQTKSFWSTVSPFMSDNGKHREKIILRKGDDVIVDTKDICNVFNDCFINAANEMCEPDNINIAGPLEDIFLAYKDHPSIKEIQRRHAVDTNDMFKFSHVTEVDIFKKLSTLNSRKASGYDEQPPHLLKLGAPILSYTLLPIVNNAFAYNVFPSDLKHAEVSPLFKKDDKMNEDKYRPVSVLVCQSKIFESLMLDQLMEYMKGKLSDLLSAYRKGCSTQHVLLHAIEEWKTALDRGQHVGVVMMDLSKAFDAIPHGLLLAKLHSYGLSKNACEMIRSYLTNRKQRVKINDVRSSWQYTVRGVPQGSQAGPRIFNIFLNDMFYFIEELCQIINYADDNSLAIIDYNINVIKAELEVASGVAIKWFKHNFMKANASKFQALCVSKAVNPPVLELLIDGIIVRSEPQVKLFGIHIDQRLTFTYHITEMCKKASSQARALARLSSMLDIESNLMIFNAFVVSNFLYCPLVWHMCCISDCKKIEKIQERALRYVLNDFNNTYSNLLHKASKSTLYLTRLRFLAIEIFKTLNDMSPIYMKDVFIRKEVTYGLRDVNLLVQPKFKTITYGHNTIKYQGSKLWNNLPHDLKKMDSLSSFKCEIQKWSGPDCHCGYCLQCSLARM